MLTKIHNPRDGPMKIACLMSGSGSNVIEILKAERANLNSEYRVEVIFSDQADSKAVEIGKRFDVPVVTRDVGAFYKARGWDTTKDPEMRIRPEFDSETVRVLSSFGINVAAYAGYMLRASPVLVRAFIGVNVHPADLTVVDEKGEARYKGDRAVAKAILAGERYLRSTTHMVEEAVDSNRGVLMVSRPVEVKLPQDFDPSNRQLVDRVAKEHQNQLKEIGDWEIFPRTLRDMAKGRYAHDEKNNLYYDNTPIPKGVML